MMMRRRTLGVRTLHRSLVAATMVMIVMGLVGMIIVTVVMVVEGVPGHLGLQVRANSHIPPRIQIMVRMIRLEQEEALDTTRIHRMMTIATALLVPHIAGLAIQSIHSPPLQLATAT